MSPAVTNDDWLQIGKLTYELCTATLLADFPVQAEMAANTFVR